MHTSKLSSVAHTFVRALFDPDDAVSD